MFVSCFEFGDDLYIGWTFWLFMSPARWLLHGFGRTINTLRMRGSAIRFTLQFDSA